MKLTCPSCATTFLVEAEQLGARGRSVRCGNCGHAWHQGPLDEPSPAPEAPDVAPQPAPVEEPEAAWAPAEPTAEPPAVADAPQGAEAVPADEPSAERPPRRAAAARQRRAQAPSPRPGLAGGWLLLVAVVAALGAGFYFGRAQVVAHVPAAARLYALVGLQEQAAPAATLQLRDVTTVPRLVDGERLVVIAGAIANESDQTVQVPPLRASLLDAGGTELAQWTFSADAATLPPGAIGRFETSTRAPAVDSSLALGFVPEGE